MPKNKFQFLIGTVLQYLFRYFFAPFVLFSPLIPQKSLSISLFIILIFLEKSSLFQKLNFFS